MRRIMFGLAACVLGLALTAGVAEAAHGHGRHHHHHHRHGWRHHGWRHNHRWGYRVWSPIYNRYQYWDADQRCFYYYDASCGNYSRCP